MNKILILGNYDIGLYNFRKELIKELLKTNEVIIGLPYGRRVEDLKSMGCIFIETPMNRRGANLMDEISLFFLYLKIIKKINPKLVMTYTIKPNIYGGIASRIRKIPYVANITGLGTSFQKEGLFKKGIRFLYKIALKKASVVFCENPENKEVLIKEKVLKKAQTVVLNGAGVNLEEYPFEPYPPDGEIHFLFVGRMMKEKGIEEYFQAAEALKKNNENLVFNVVGIPEEDYKEEIEALEKKGIIKFHGFQKTVQPFYKSCHCFILPSYHEGMANTILEAGATGRPIITTNIHGCLEGVVDGESGFLCEARSTESLEKVVYEFIRLSYEKKTEMGLKSWEFVGERFDKKRVVDETLRRLRL